MKKIVIGDVVPTAAKAFSLPKLPTTIVSAKLKVICRMFASMSGQANIRTLLKSGPFTMFSSLFFFTITSYHEIYLTMFPSCFLMVFLMMKIQVRKWTAPVIIQLSG